MLILISQKVQEEVLKEYEKMKQVSSDMNWRLTLCIFFLTSSRKCLLVVWKLFFYSICACFVFIAKLPQGETALRVPAQQAGSHQEADRWFRPAQSPALVLRAQHTLFSLISIESGSLSNQEGESNWLLFNPPSVTASSHTSLSLPFSFSTHPFSFLHSFLILEFHWLHCCLQSWIFHLTPLPLFAFLIYYFFSSVEELLWNLMPLDQWKELPACVKGFEETLQLFLPFLKDFIFRQKKRTKKKYFWVSEKILTCI